MRPHLTLFFLAFFTAYLSAQSYDPAFVTPRLQDRIQMMPESQHDIYILLADRVDAGALLHRFQEERTPLAVRTETVISQLQAKADATQEPLLELLRNHPGLAPGSIRSIWITNMICATGSAELIAALSHHPAVEYIDWNAPPQLETFTRETSPAPIASPNGIEAGLAAINAPAMWAMGYTGYGTITFTSDTGVDPWHPALFTKYRGIYASPGASFLGNANGLPYDCGDHGTHVTGTMVGLDRNSNDTIGVAFNAQWIGAPSISGCNNNGISTFEAFQWALNPDGNAATTDDMPAVINNSWYDPGLEDECNSGFVDLFNALEAAGIAVVFSAGNAGPGISSITPPKNINTDLVNVFCVGNLNGNSADLAITNSSSRGPSICGGDSSLLIKPEVSAPGTSVRSSVPGGGYANFTGTSMASPHVCGAILLLKEAFPEASGTDLKLALYFSATDLGEPGEDNTYGMGIINLEAAFNYMVDQGNIPADPIAANDLMLYDLRTSDIYCNGSLLSPEVRLENSGTTTISSFTIDYWMEGGTVFEYEWTGTLEPGERITMNLPGEAVSPSGNYVYAEITTVNGIADDRSLNNRLFRPVETIDKESIQPLVITTDDGFFCEGSPAFLRAEGDGPGTPIFSWYDVEVGGNPLATGDVFETPPLDGPATYYVDAEYLAKAGMESPDLGDTQLFELSDGEGLEFTVYQPLTLQSVWVDPNGTGPRILEVRDSDGDLVSTRFINITVNEPQRIDLNINLQPGEDYRLIVGGGLGFRYNLSGHDFPYELSDYMSITRSMTPFGGTTQIYYFFYDWEVLVAEPCGRTEVSVSPSSTGAGPGAAFSLNADTVEVGAVVSLTNQTAGDLQWLWVFGDGSSSTEFEPVHSFSNPGIYTISLSAAAAAGCTDVYSREVVVLSELTSALTELQEGSSGFGIYPNPARDILWLDLPDENAEAMPYRIFDAAGRIVSEGILDSGQRNISLNGIANGLYLLQLRSGQNWIGEKFVIQH